MPPLASNAQAMRAILLASATATTLNGLRARSCVSPWILLRLLARVAQHRTGSDHQNASQTSLTIASFNACLFANGRRFRQLHRR